MRAQTTSTPLFARFWPKVDCKGPNECWVWLGAVSQGYGRINAGRRGEGLLQAHRVAYEMLIGEIPEGLDLDHLCRNRACVNPSHLEPVTRRENLLRGDTLPAREASRTHCVHGHEYTEANTFVTAEGARKCRTCDRERWHNRRALLSA